MKLNSYDCIHFITAVMFFGYVIFAVYKASQGQWPSREEVGIIGLALMGGAAMGLAAVWWLGDDDKGDLL
tara:strand:+ start:293 stop:502 length:210 start_codon:yes stop_codon:yes gene_type:complete